MCFNLATSYENYFHFRVVCQVRTTRRRRRMLIKIPLKCSITLFVSAVGINIVFVLYIYVCIYVYVTISTHCYTQHMSGSSKLLCRWGNIPYNIFENNIHYKFYIWQRIIYLVFDKPRCAYMNVGVKLCLCIRVCVCMWIFECW